MIFSFLPKNKNSQKTQYLFWSKVKRKLKTTFVGRKQKKRKKMAEQ